VEVVDNLGEDAAPVDGVDGAEVEGCVGVFVGKQSLENVLNFVREDMLLGKKRGGGGAYLAIVKGSSDRQVVDIIVEDGSHLSLLDGADTAGREHDEDGDVLFASQAIDGSRASITTRSADNGQMMAIYKHTG
jgi:hypothetical protein